jgi:hypothetical protein
LRDSPEHRLGYPFDKWPLRTFSPPKKRTQEQRDRLAFIRYARKNPDKADKLYREIKSPSKRVRAISETGAAMLYVQQVVLGNPGISPGEIAQHLKDHIAGAEAASQLAAIGETLAAIGIKTAIEEVLLQEAQAIALANEDVDPCLHVDARTMREITGRALPLSLVVSFGLQY